MAVLCGQLDISQISEDEMIAISGQGAWVGFDVEEQIYELPNSPYGYVRIKFNNPCWATPCASDTTALVGQAFLMTANSLASTLLKSSTENPNVQSELDLPGSGVATNNFCGVDVELLLNMQNTVDSLQINEKGFQSAAIKPTSCVIPLKSNVFSYGPWASSNFATTYGGAEIQVNNDLSPWLFGSIGGMNVAGQELANTSIIGLSRAEKGSVTVLGLPAYTIGTALSAGPVLSNISCSFGSNGLTTTYDFSTYTPKFGQVSRAIIEKYKTINKIRNEQIRFLRQSAIINNKIQLKRNTNVYNRNNELSKSLSDKNSMGRVLVGEIFDYQQTLNNDTGQRTIVGMTTLSKSSLEMRGSSYAKKGFISLDGLYGPVSISGDGQLPRFIAVSGNTKAWSYAPQPPFIVANSCSSCANNAGDLDAEAINEESEFISIHKNYLNPLANPNTIPYHNGINAGHCIDLVGRDQSVTNNGLITNFYRPEWAGKYSNDYRFLSMRGPLVLHSWGYDTDGKPVPNEADNETSTKNGNFQKENLTNRFLGDWLQKPKTWPVAPIDLRLDRERGVWVSPREHKIIVVELLESIGSYGKGYAKIINYGKSMTDEDGNIITNENTKIIVEDRIGTNLIYGSKHYAYFDTITSTYLILGSQTHYIGYTEGLWYKNTSKSVMLVNPAIQNGSVSLSYSNTNILAYNFIENTGRVEDYYVILSLINGIYVYVNGGACTD